MAEASNVKQARLFDEPVEFVPGALPLPGAADPSRLAVPLEQVLVAAPLRHMRDAGLINRYRPGERDVLSPIVPVSPGIAARFVVIGPRRRRRASASDVQDGDIVVFGGVARSHHHGIRPIKPAPSARFGECRLNLTFRRAR